MLQLGRSYRKSIIFIIINSFFHFCSTNFSSASHKINYCSVTYINTSPEWLKSKFFCSCIFWSTSRVITRMVYVQVEGTTSVQLWVWTTVRTSSTLLEMYNNNNVLHVCLLLKLKADLFWNLSALCTPTKSHNWPKMLFLWIN